MIVSGSIILLFLIIHLKTFFVPYRITGDMDGRTLYELTRDAFYNPLYSGFYVVCMVLLALHLHHGISSAFQTVGLRHPNYYGGIKLISVILSIVICGGFAAMPLYFVFDKFMS